MILRETRRVKGLSNLQLYQRRDQALDASKEQFLSVGKLAIVSPGWVDETVILRRSNYITRGTADSIQGCWRMNHTTVQMF